MGVRGHTPRDERSADRTSSRGQRKGRHVTSDLGRVCSLGLAPTNELPCAHDDTVTDALGNRVVA